ncbi:MAG: PepSY domain-containing protein [Rhodospirillales bacterium]|nr:PepSY domain-containing protein [Rhodospirillales bacterium]
MKTVFLVLLGLMLVSAPALADRDSDRARRAVQAGDIRPLAEALAKVEATHPGRVLDVELEDGHGRPIYEVKLLTAEGQVLKIILDAKSLEILKVKGGMGRPERKER